MSAIWAEIHLVGGAVQHVRIPVLVTSPTEWGIPDA